jgi:arylsulfatase
MRYENWKIVFEEQRAQGTMRIWAEPVYQAARPETLRPAVEPLRARRRHLEQYYNWFMSDGSGPFIASPHP